MGKKDTPALDIAKHPQWETHILETYPDGRIRCVPDNSVWLVRELPQASVPDAESVRAGVEVGASLDRAQREIADLTQNPIRRVVSKNNYREIQTHWVNVPRKFTADPENPIADHLNAQFGEVETYMRKAILAVRLIPTMGVAKGGVLERVGNAIESFIESTREKKGAPIEDYDRDAMQVSIALSRAGLEIPDPATMSMADSWFNYGKAASVPTISHDDHIHFFKTPRDAYRAHDVSPRDCALWPADVSEHAITFAAVSKFTMSDQTAASPLARWVLALTNRDVEARCISIRGRLEPGKVSRQEIKAQHSKYTADLEELRAAGKVTNVEFDERLAQLAALEDEYAYDPPPTLIETSIIIAFSGVVEDIEQVQPPGVELSPMLNKQKDAFAEMKIGSPVRANPHLLEPTSALIAYSGIPSLSEGGDSPREGTLVGFSEIDRQPVYISPSAAFEGDAAPLLACYADTGAGKTVLLQSMAVGIHKLGAPQLIVNPKRDSSMKDTLVAAGAHHMTLSELEGTGMLDPFRTFSDPLEAASNAYSMINSTNPFGGEAAWNEYSTGIIAALRHGALNGAQATGQALQMGADARKADGSRRFDLPQSAVDKIFEAAEASPLFGASFAFEPGRERFRLGDGTLLVEVGKSAFRRPAEDVIDVRLDTNLEVRASVNLLRTLVWAGAASLSNRGGVIHFDESWMLEKADATVLEEVGRMARSWSVSVWLYTQKATPHVQMGLKSYLSRALIGHLKDPIEARAALDLFGFKNERIVDRIVAKQYTHGGRTQNDQALHAQFEPDPERPGKKRVKRGSVFYSIDLKGRAVPTEVKLSEEFQYLSSSTPEVVAQRKAEQERLAQMNGDLSSDEGSPLAA